MATPGPATTLIDTARALRPRILAARERIEVGRRLPDDLALELARAGFFRVFSSIRGLWRWPVGCSSDSARTSPR